MVQKPLEPSQVKSVLKSIREGMEVFDSRDDKVGTVDDLYFGADGDEMMRHGAGAATSPDPSLRANSLVDEVVEGMFGADDLPQEMRQRLLNEGFIRIDGAGLLASHRYVLLEQIARVHEDRVHLNVPRDGLLKR